MNSICSLLRLVPSRCRILFLVFMLKLCNPKTSTASSFPPVCGTAVKVYPPVARKTIGSNPYLFRNMPVYSTSFKSVITLNGSFVVRNESSVRLTS